MQGVEGSTPTGGTCPKDFSDPIDQDIRTQWALSWKIVVSEWRSVIAVSLNVGGGVRLIKPAKLCMCTQNTTNTTRRDARRRVCAAMVPYRWATRGTSLRELEYTHTLHRHFCNICPGQCPIISIVSGQDCSILLQQFEEASNFESTRISKQLLPCSLKWIKFCNFLFFWNRCFFLLKVY